VNVICEEWKVSIRKVCGALEFDRSTFHYRSRKRDQAGIEARIKAICETRIRYGYRRVHVMLQREGWDINVKRTHRIYNELGLQLRNKAPKRRVKAKLREDRAPATRPNDVWAMDFVHDQLATARRSGSSPSSTPSRASRPWSTRSSAIGPRMSLRRSSGFVLRLAIPGRSASIRDRGSSPAVSTSGLMPRA